MTGDARDTVLDMAERTNATAIVMGSRGLNTVRRTLLGELGSAGLVQVGSELLLRWKKKKCEAAFPYTGIR